MAQTIPANRKMPVTDIAIRAAKAEDADLIRQFMAAHAAYLEQGADMVASSEDYLRDAFRDVPAFEARIAEVGAEPAGIAILVQSYSTFAGRPILYLETLYVDEAMRRRGIGKALVRAAARLAITRGFARLDLNVLDWNPARALYEQLGMTETGERAYSLKNEALANLAMRSEK